MDRLGITFKGSFGELSAIRLSDNDEIHNGGSIAGDGWRFGGRRRLFAGGSGVPHEHRYDGKRKCKCAHGFSLVGPHAGHANRYDARIA